MFSKILKEKKIAVTKQRILLLQTLSDLSKPVTIDELRKSMDGEIDTATIYRSLSLLVDNGILHQTDFQEGAAYYEFQKHHHHHLVCTKCKKKEGVDICPKIPSKKIHTESGFTITHHMFEIFGICKICSSL